MAILVSVDWLKEHLHDDNLVVVDIRGEVGKIELGGGREQAIYAGHPESYEAGHIPGSVFVNWTTDIVDPNAEVKAQIATPEAFAERMVSLGIGDDTYVVVVDNDNCHLAARLWWALKYMGHTSVSMLDGGYAGWIAAGGEMTADPTVIDTKVVFSPRVDSDLRVDGEDVVHALDNPDVQIVDARSAEMFHGMVQRGSRGGHIPGAINLSAKTMMNDDGTYKSVEEIRELALDAGIDLNRRIISYCNGGVTATQAMAGLEIAGATNLTNYDGSWNEWGERFDLPVEEDRNLFGLSDSTAK